MNSTLRSDNSKLVNYRQASHYGKVFHLGRISRFILCATLFLGFSKMAMPVPRNDEVASMYPWWAQAIRFGNIQIYEALFLAWLPYGAAKALLRASFFKNLPGRYPLCMLAGLAIWTALISLAGPEPLTDILRSARVLLNITVFCSVILWGVQKPMEPLMSAVLGITYGTVANLIMTFSHPIIIAETVRLSGQNTPGVVMGLGIHLTAWWYYRERHKLLIFLCLLSLAAFIWGCGISFSRIGWFAGLCGLAAWVIVFAAKIKKEKKYNLVSLILKTSMILALVCASFLAVPRVREEGSHILALVNQKFTDHVEKGGDNNRMAFALISAKIVARHPLGVGYSGYYEAHQDLESTIENTITIEENEHDLNPHSSFLWYLTAGGIIGGYLSIYSFLRFLTLLFRSYICVAGRVGAWLASAIAGPFLLVGCTVPYLYNSFTMLVPVALVSAWACRKDSSISI